MTREINRNSGAPSYPIATVVVLAKNEERNIARCLGSLALQTLDPSLWEIWIIDHLSTDKTVAIAEDFRSCHPFLSVSIHSLERNHLGRSRAWAISSSSSPYVAFIDADCEAPPHWIDALVHGIENSRKDAPEIVAVGSGNTAPSSGHPIHIALQSLSSTVIGHGGSTQAYRPDRSTDVAHLPTCNVLYDRARALAVGNFSDRFEFVCEDLELSWRLVKAGGRLRYLPDCDVLHHHRPELGAWSAKMFRYGRGQIRVAEIHPEHLAGSKGLPILAITIELILIALAPLMALGLALIYLALITAVSFMITKPLRFGQARTLVILFACTHFSYAAGELYGVLEWLARKVSIQRPESIAAK